MDWESGKQRLTGCITKYRYAILILLAGILILTMPKRQEESAKAPAEVSCRDLQTQLAEILEKISGVGKVEVLLTQRCGEEILYQTDSDAGDSANREDTVILTDSDREETGLVRQVLPPVYLGAVIVAQGGDSPAVKLAIVEAVMDVTGLKSHQITVLKMK